MINVFGAVLFVVGLVIGAWLTYLQWWVHPEYTRPQMFWAYPWQAVVMIALFAVGVGLFTRGWR